MPELDYMVLADYVRADAGMMHIMGAGIDTLGVPAVPAARTLSLAIRITTDSSDQPGEVHTLAVVFQGSDRVLATLTGNFKTPEKVEDVPIHWKTGLGIALQLSLPIPEYGDYSLELTIDGKFAKSIDIRAVPVKTPTP